MKLERVSKFTYRITEGTEVKALVLKTTGERWRLTDGWGKRLSRRLFTKPAEARDHFARAANPPPPIPAMEETENTHVRTKEDSDG